MTVIFSGAGMMAGWPALAAMTKTEHTDMMVVRTDLIKTKSPAFEMGLDFFQGFALGFRQEECDGRNVDDGEGGE